VALLLVAAAVVTTMSFTSLFDIRARPDRSDHRPLVFGIGLPRTGTSSLTTALSMVGRTAQHFPYKFDENRELYLRKLDAFVDLSVLGVNPLDLYHTVPGAHFIYTTRDDTDWLRGMAKLDNLLSAYAVVCPCAQTIYTQFRLVFGGDSASRLTKKRLYEADVAELERLAPDRVLRLDIVSECDDAALWAGLHTFLDGACTPVAHGTCFPHTTEVPLHIKQVWSNLVSGLG
jgi:hypothetical protein